MYYYQLKSQIGFYVSFLLVASCNSNGKNPSTTRHTEHPFEKNIPYFGREHIEISRNVSFQQTNEWPEGLISLQLYLEDSTMFEHRQLDILAGGATHTDIVSPGPDQLVVLNKDSERIEQYDLKTNTATSLAPRGQGPGDIAYPMELIKKNQSIYVAMEDMRISRFDCRSPVCEYKETIPLEFSPLSIAIHEQQFAVLGHTPFLGEEEVIDNHAVRLLDWNGNTNNAFGYFYDTDEFIVRFSFRNGTLRYSPLKKHYILAFETLPLIYIFDEQLQLTDTYVMVDFIQGIIFYNSQFRSASPQFRNFTLITDITIVEDRFALVKTVTRSEAGFNIDGETYHNWRDYYAIDLSARQGYYLGTDTNGPNRLLYLTEEGIVLNQIGSLYLIQ